MTGGRLGRWECRNTMLRHGRACAAIRLRSLRHGAQKCSRAHSNTAGDSFDTTERGLRHDLVCATIQPSVRHDTTPCARPGRSGRAAWLRVCTWCTQPNFGLSALFQSLFGPLFMNTVHKFLSKINKNK